MTLHLSLSLSHVPAQTHAQIYTHIHMDIYIVFVLVYSYISLAFHLAIINVIGNNVFGYLIRLSFLVGFH